MANTILERIQEKYPGTTDDARNIAEALGMAFGTGGRGSGAIKDVLYGDFDMIFDPNGGEGEAFSIKLVTGVTGVTFPECPFTPPEGKVFDYWCMDKNGTNRESSKFRPGFVPGTYAVDVAVTEYAIYKDAEPEPEPAEP